MSLADQLAGHARASLALEAPRPDWGAGLRTATAMMLPLAVGYFTGHPELLWTGLGGWLGMLADPGGPYRARAEAMIFFALLGALATFTGGIAGASSLIGVPALSVGLLAGMGFQYQSAGDTRVWSIGVLGGDSIWGALSNVFVRYYL